MGAAQWEFSPSHRKSLKVDKPSSDKASKKSRRRSAKACPSAVGKDMRRQSGLLIFIRTVQFMPLCTTLSAAVIWLVTRFLPRPVRWWTGAWSAGLLALALAVICAAVVWGCSKWQYDGQRLSIRSGVLTRCELSLSAERILHVRQEVTPLTSLFRCGWLYIHISSPAEKPQVRLLLPARECTLLLGQLLPDPPGRFHSYRAAPLSLWLASLGGEGMAAFVSAAVSSFSVLRDTVGSDLNSRLAQLMQMRGVTWAATAVVLALWLAKVLHTRLTFGRMGHYRHGDVIALERGVISRRTERIRRRELCGLDIRYSLLSLLTRSRSCSLLTPGGTLLPYLPPVDERRLRIESAVVSPHTVRVCTVASLSGGIAYGAGRWALCLCALPLTSLVRRLFPSWDGAFYVVGLTAAVLLLWRALTTTISARRAGLTVFADCIELTAVRRLTIHTLRVFRPSVGMIRITQSPLSRLLGRCTVRVTPRGRAASLACIKLPFERTVAACERVMK